MDEYLAVDRGLEDAALVLELPADIAAKWVGKAVKRGAADADTVATHYVHEQGKAVKAGDRLGFRMAKGGGFVVKFTK